MRRLSAIFLALLLIPAVGCGRRQPIIKTGFALDTTITIAIYSGGGEQTLEAVFGRISELESIFSRTDPQSEVWALNHAGGEWLQVSEPLREVLEKSRYYAELSGGKFDITVCPAVELWDFNAANPSVPAAEALAEAMKSVDYRNVEINGGSVRLLNSAQIDLGAIAKGYIADRAVDCLRENGASSAIVNLGGNVVTLGKKTWTSNFNIGIQKPFETGNQIIGKVASTDSSVVTSGVYERFFRHDGKLYHHILDTKTGMPIDSGLVSVTVLTKDSVDGDALSTVLFALGPQEGLALAESLDGVEALFIAADGTETATGGFNMSK